MIFYIVMILMILMLIESIVMIKQEKKLNRVKKMLVDEVDRVQIAHNMTSELKTTISYYQEALTKSRSENSSKDIKIRGLLIDNATLEETLADMKSKSEKDTFKYVSVLNSAIDANKELTDLYDGVFYFKEKNIILTMEDLDQIGYI